MGKLAAFCLVATPLLTVGQDDTACVAGIYNTRQDLVENKLTHKINTGTEGYKFGFLFPADLKLTIKIETPDTTLEFPPGSVYGYHKCGWMFRYYEGGDLLAQEDFYRIEEQGPLIIYSSVFISGSEIFYSRDLSSPIRRLKLKNIEEDFAGQDAFVAAAKKLSKKLPDGITSHDEKGGFDINRIAARHLGSKARR